MVTCREVCPRGLAQGPVTRSNPQEALCAPRGTTVTFLFRLCLWALLVLPWVVVAGSLWRVHVQTPPRLRRALRRLSRRARARAPLPPSRRRVPISSPGPRTGRRSPRAIDVELIAYGPVWDAEPCDPYLSSLIDRQNAVFGPPTGARAEASRATGTPGLAYISASSFIQRATAWLAGDRYSSTLAGLRGSCRMPSSS